MALALELVLVPPLSLFVFSALTPALALTFGSDYGIGLGTSTLVVDSAGFLHVVGLGLG